jgi:hypothetical protein
MFSLYLFFLFIGLVRRQVAFDGDDITQAVWVWQWDILPMLCHKKNSSKKLLTRADPDKIRLGRHPYEVCHP